MTRIFIIFLALTSLAACDYGDAYGDSYSASTETGAGSGGY